MRWQPAFDHDVFDRVAYRLLVDRDSAAVAHVVAAYDKNPELFASLINGRMLFNVESERTFYPLADLSPGDYYWALIAADRFGQVRFAERDAHTIARFHVPSPPIEIKDIQFEHHPYITADDFQGVIRVMLANPSNRSSKPMTLRMEDGVETLDHSLESIVANDPELVLPDRGVQQQSVPAIAAGENLVVEFPWHTPLQGKHRLRFTVEADGAPAARDERVFHTIPKGSMAPDDTLLTVTVSKKIIDLPLINEITFDKGSAVLQDEYTDASSLQPVVTILAERLKNNPQLSVQLQGFIDPNSGETDLSLAQARAEAVRDALIARGAHPTQFVIGYGRLPKRFFAAGTQDLEWILNERRFVRITADNGAAAVLFAPIRQQEAEYRAGELFFSAKIRSVLPMTVVEVNSAAGNFSARQEMPVFERGNDVSAFVWRAAPDDIPHWLDQSVSYTLALIDSLGRRFESAPRTVRVAAHQTVVEQVYSIPAQFAGADPSAEHYWKRLTQLAETLSGDSEMRVRFEGHACAIGHEAVNDALSQRRAQRFSQAFQQLLRRQHAGTLDKMVPRIDQPVGWGETRALTVSAHGRADNRTALGRKLNRRIEVVFYRPAT